MVRNQADVELSRLVATMATVNYLAWAIPAVGFVGTVRGLAGGVRHGRRTDAGRGRVHASRPPTS